jgi:hypothetical protein
MLWHFQKFLQCIKYIILELIPSIQFVSFLMRIFASVFIRKTIFCLFDFFKQLL